VTFTSCTNQAVPQKDRAIIRGVIAARKLQPIPGWPADGKGETNSLRVLCLMKVHYSAG